MHTVGCSQNFKWANPQCGPALATVFATRDRDEWIEVLQAAGVPCAPIQTMGQVIAHPQTQALDIMRRSADDALTFIGLP